jgi:hypothetical protein
MRFALSKQQKNSQTTGFFRGYGLVEKLKVFQRLPKRASSRLV